MANYNYETLLGDNVRFLQGTQLNLNALMIGGTNAGNAIEGAFYLTTDTHKLYIGRKITNNENTSLNGKVVPELITSGISTVQTTAGLTAAQTAGTVKTGDIYYVINDNILAIYEETIDTNNPVSNYPTTGGQWVQINAPSGITGFDSSVNVAGTVATITPSIQDPNHPSGLGAPFTISGSAANTTGQGSVTVEQNGTNGLTIKASDTTYTVGTDASGHLGLKKNGSSSLENTKITLSGANTVGVTTAATGTITITGPSFQAPVAEVADSGTGFQFATKYTSGNDNLGSVATASTTLDPTITIGDTNADGLLGQNINLTNTGSTVHFSNGDADLDVYTTAQTRELLQNYVNSKMATANAMSYKGTVGSTSDLPSQNVSIGDTYKATADFSSSLSGNTVKKGDLIIVSSSNTEDANGYVTGTITYDVVPSGDEPFPVASITGAATAAAAIASTDDGVIAINDSNANSNSIITVNVEKQVSNNKVLLDVIKTDNKTATLQARHATLTRTDDNTKTISAGSNSDVDSIGSGKKVFYVLPDGASNIINDGFGHINKVETAKVVFEHNKLDTTSAETSYDYPEAVVDNNPNPNYGKQVTITTSLEDTLGNSIDNDIVLKSDTLQILPSNTNSPNDVTVNLVWGSF